MSGLSVSRLCHLFKSYTGMGPARYLKLLRLQRAKKLLEASALSVKEIAARLGYGDPSRFGEDFRRTVGFSPQRHRERGSQKGGASHEVDGAPPGSHVLQLTPAVISKIGI